MIRILMLATVWVLLLVCPREGQQDSIKGIEPRDRVVDLPVPLGLMWPTFPDGSPPRQIEVDVGRQLFFDPVLSEDDTISCATCHNPDTGFADPRSVSLGIGGAAGSRNATTLLNAVYFTEMGWGGEHASLEEQSLAAITNPVEMGLTRDEIGPRVRAQYGAALEALYGKVSAKSVAAALAAFQRTLIAGNSPFDRFIYLRDQGAVDESAKRGFQVFIGKGRCIQCHFMRSQESHPFGGSTGFYTDNRYHNIGIDYDEHGRTDDLGRYMVTKKNKDKGAYKTPMLRNVALTAPYMHDGSMKTLEEVVEHYNKGGIPNPNLDPDVMPLNLTDEEKKDLVSFMETLTSSDIERAITALVPSNRK